MLNGTTIPGLARGVANKIQTDGFRIGNVTNATDQSRSATLVLYAPGRKSAALSVAKGIGLGSDAEGRLLDARGGAQDDLRVIGSLRIGEAWESIAVPELRVQAEAIARGWPGRPG